MATLDARSVVGLAGVAPQAEEGEAEVLMRSDESDDERILRITAIKNRFS